MNPWVMLGILVSALALFGSGYGLGAHHADNACAAAQGRAQQAAQTAADTVTARRDQVAQARETSREQIRVVYRTIKERVDENIFNSTGCLDADGVRVWNAANAGSAEALRGEPDYRLPAAATGQIGGVSRPAAQPHRGDGAVRAVPGSGAEAGGVPGAVTAPPHPNPLP